MKDALPSQRASLMRRRLAKLALTLSLLGHGAWAGDRIGAIRWDAWYGQNSPPAPGFYACRSLGPPSYHFRAPWFTKQTAPDRMLCDGDQQGTMDAEIAYAKTAHIDYWAFVWYKPDSPMLDAWSIYQSSPRKADVNWTIIAGYGQFHHDMTRSKGFASPEKYAALFLQSNFEKIMNVRPLIYLFSDTGSSTSNLAKDVSTLRAAVRQAGGANPYVVVMSGSSKQAAADAEAIGADAISAYAFAPHVGEAPYQALDLIVQSFWDAEAATGKPIIPLAMTGYDRRPRLDHPVPWEMGRPEPAGGANFYLTASPKEVAAHVSSMFHWMRDHPGAVPAHEFLIYAWNEFDEGGWLCPTWTEHGPDTARIEALSNIRH